MQLLHQLKPMISVWDDHEITNDTWKEGAQNHSDNEGSFFVERRIMLSRHTMNGCQLEIKKNEIRFGVVFL